MSQDLYSEFLLEHARLPQNNIALNNATCTTHVLNEGCADSLDLYLKIEKECVSKASFTGTLCALSTASSSLFTEFLKGKNIDELRLVTPGSLYNLLGVTIVESRTRCVLLCYEALQKALQTCFSLKN